MISNLDAVQRLQGGNLRGKVIINIAGEEAYEGSTGSSIYFNPSARKSLD